MLVYETCHIIQESNENNESATRTDLLELNQFLSFLCAVYQVCHSWIDI